MSDGGARIVNHSAGGVCIYHTGQVQRRRWLTLIPLSLGERYRQAKPDDAKKPQNTQPGADETLLDTKTHISDLLSRPESKHSLELGDHNSYFVQHTNWISDQPMGQSDAHVSWPPMDVNFYLQQGESCSSTHSPNNELSGDISANGYLNGADEASIQASSEYFMSPQIRGQFSNFPSAGTCHPALLTPPASSSSAVRKQNHLD